MSQTVTQTVAPQKRDFVNRRVLRRNPVVVQQPRAVPTAQDAKVLYDAAALKAQPTIDAADRVLAAVPLAQQVAAAQGPYAAASRQLAADLQMQTANYAEALTDLPAKVTEANAVLVAKGKADAAAAKQKQFDGQAAAYDAMAPVLGDVKRSYLPDGAAKRIGKEDLAAGRQFKAYLAALQALEDAKRGVNPTQPTPPELAQDVKAKCDGVVAAAQAYLDHYAKDPLSSQQKNKDSLTKKRYCEESLVSARQYGMAMDLDATGKPTPGQPWDRKTETRVAGLCAAMNFETGYQKATGLKGEGEAGASDSYWIKSAAPKQGRDEKGKPTVTMVANKRGEAIFKPADGEQAPDGSSDRKGAGAAKEALASANAKLFAAQTGIDLGVPETNVVSIGAYAVAGAQPNGPPLIGSAQQHAGVSKQISDLPRAALKQVKAAEAHKMALMDIMSLSVDRHGGNIMVDDADPTDPKLIPIDHGGTLPSRADFPNVKKRMAGVNFSAVGARPDASIVNTLLTIPASYENFDPEMQAKIEMLRPDEMEQGMKDQRAALDAVHPDLGAGGKVGDDSFHMSKRAMMFLKKAAKTLSPAEIQIALGAHGEQLFDASDANFDTIADQVIAEAAPKKSAYLEFMTTPKDQQAIFLEWLDDNDWTLVDEAGKNSPEAFLMRDPVNALKLFKAGTKNNNPLKVMQIPDPKTEPGDPNAQPDAKTKDAILEAFPGLSKDADDDRWNRRLAAWNAIKSKGGMDAYKAVCDATGGEAASIGDVPKLLDLWTEINKRQNAAALAQLKPSPGPEPVTTLKRTLAWVANQQVAAQQLNQASAAGAAIDDGAALAASATRLLTAIRNVIGGIEDRAQATTFGQRADDAAARLAQRDGAGAEADARALNIEVNEFALQEVKGLAIALADGLATLQVSDEDRKSIAEARGDAKDVTSLDAAKGLLDKVRKLDQQIRADGAQPKPVIPARPASNAPQAAPPRQRANLPGALPNFSWDPAAASAVKKQAVKAKMIKDTKTGLTEALAAVNKVRDRIDLIQDNWQPSTKIPMLEAVLNAYAEFRGFVSSKLRGVAVLKNADWAAYCNSAADLTEAAIKATNARLDGVKNGTGV